MLSEPFEHPAPSSTTASSCGEQAGRTAIDHPALQASFTSMEIGPDGRREAVSHLKLSGLYCVACAGAIEAALLAEPGVIAASASYAGQRATVRWDPERTTPSCLVDRVTSAGYEAEPDAAEPARTLRRREQRRALWRTFVASFCAMQVMMYAAPLYLADPDTIGDDLRRLLQWASWLLSIPVLAFAAGPFFHEAWRGLRQRRVRMELPISLGIGTAFVASSAALFDPTGIFGPDAYFDSLTMFVSLLLIARLLATRAQDRVASALEDAIHRVPALARKVGQDGRTVLVPLHEVAVGDLLRVHAGEAFPADGAVTDGTTSADEALLTGESIPVGKKPGDLALAGSLNLSAPVTLRVERLGADTRHDGIVTLLRGAANERPRLVQAADRLAGPFLLVVLLLAFGSAVYWATVDPARAAWVAVSVLIVTCPCALSLAAPSAMLTAAGAMSRRGVLVSRLDAVESLASLDILCFDKTGTLTEDRLQLERMEPAWPASARYIGPAELLARAASLASSSNHPSAQAIVRAHAIHPDPLPGPSWRDLREVPGSGIEAVDEEGVRFRLGAGGWAIGIGATAPQGMAAAQSWLAREGTPLASFTFSESVRPDAAAAVGALRGTGLDILVLSGDAESRVRAMADRLGIADARGALRPEDKLAVLTGLQNTGHRVGMAGDGLNDAPVMARADVSFAMAGGSALTRAQADFLVLSGRLSDIAFARTTARRTMRVVRQSFGWALAYNAVSVPLALAGWFPPWAAAIGMGASSLVVVLNAIRIDRHGHRRAPSSTSEEPENPAVACRFA